MWALDTHDPVKTSGLGGAVILYRSGLIRDRNKRRNSLSDAFPPGLTSDRANIVTSNGGDLR